MSEKDSETYRLANLKINLSPFSHRMHIVVEVTPKGLISSSSYVTYSIRFLNSTPLPYQCHAPRQDHSEDDDPLRVPRAQARIGVGKLTDGNSVGSIIRTCIRGHGRNVLTWTICIPS